MYHSVWNLTISIMRKREIIITYASLIYLGSWKVRAKCCIAWTPHFRVWRFFRLLAAVHPPSYIRRSTSTVLHPLFYILRSTIDGLKVWKLEHDWTVLTRRIWSYLNATCHNLTDAWMEGVQPMCYFSPSMISVLIVWRYVLVETEQIGRVVFSFKLD